MLIGAIFVVLCDDLARVLFPGEIPLGILTSLIGRGHFYDPDAALPSGGETMSAAPLLQFEQLRFGYPQTTRPVLHDFHLEIAPGTVTAILEPNGAGKTTLLHLAIGWLQPQSGQIRLQQQPIASYSRRSLGQWIGLVPQTEHFSFEYSLLEFVCWRVPYLPTLTMPEKTDYEIALDALGQVGLDDALSIPCG